MALICFGHPPIDPATRKALALPLLNPFDRHGRIFFFAWFSFLLSFLAWYSMSALLTVAIRSDLGLTDNEIRNTNIVAGVASLLVRLTAGMACEKFGPRKVLVTILLASALPAGLAGTITNAMGLYFIRFAMGVAGGAFVPAQVWITAWFDKRVTGTATAFGAGWGDQGVGWTFFVMPAVYNSFLTHHEHEPRVAWRLSFLVPCILLIVVAVACFFLNDDCPTGDWQTRHLALFNNKNTSRENIDNSHNSSRTMFSRMPSAVNSSAHVNEKAKKTSSEVIVREASLWTRRGSADTVESGVSESPSCAPAPPPSAFTRQGLMDVLCPATLLLACTYATTFGSALVINSIIMPYYLENSPQWDETTAGHWAAMFGLLNIVSRPSGGIVADLIYRRFSSDSQLRAIRFKKYWMLSLTVVQGAFAMALGLSRPSSMSAIIGCMAGLGFFMQAANGAVYALLPHVNPHVNGLMGGAVGSAGNLGGVIFSIVSRFTSFSTTIWIVGTTSVALGFVLVVIHPLPKVQRDALLSEEAVQQQP